MTPKAQIGLIFLFMSVGFESWAAPANSGSTGVAAELRHNTQALLDAIAPGDVAVWERLLDEHAMYVDENDTVRNKKQLLAELKPLPTGLIGHLKIDDFVLVQRGEVAIVTHEDAEFLDYHGQVILSRFRNTDTWIHGRSGWRLLASQVLAVLKDPPEQKLSSDVLCRYVGRYQLTPSIIGRIRCTQDHLIFEQTGKPDHQYRAEVKDVFFEPGAPRTRRIFERDDSGKLTGFVDRREARDIVWKLQQD